MKKQLTILTLALFLALSLTSCGQKTATPIEDTTAPSSVTDNEAVGMANPFVEYASLEEAASAAGFRLSAPDTLDGYETRTIQVMNDEMLQVIYQSGKDTVMVRKIEGDADISGDYNEYGQERIETIDGLSVTLKGDNDLFKVAMWQNKGYSYAVLADAGLPFDAISALIAKVK